MKVIDRHAPGAFCWLELATSDQKAAKGFYGEVFGWKADDSPIGEGEFYTTFELEGRAVSAAYTMRADQKAQGIPPYWMLYVAVESADASAKRAAELGGTVLAPPFDVMDFGRMAAIHDPPGAAFCLWQSKKHTGTGVSGIPGTLCWADLNTKDPERAKEFYQALFGWKIAAGEKDPSGYLHIANGQDFIGGIPPSQKDSRIPTFWLPYIAVQDCDQTAAKIKERGGTFHLPPMTMEEVGRFAVVADPQGASFAIFQEKPRH
jgi:predicted enzyme related to lactoylglutathione lyase